MIEIKITLCSRGSLILPKMPGIHTYGLEGSKNIELGNEIYLSPHCWMLPPIKEKDLDSQQPLLYQAILTSALNFASDLKLKDYIVYIVFRDLPCLIQQGEEYYPTAHAGIAVQDVT